MNGEFRIIYEDNFRILLEDVSGGYPGTVLYEITAKSTGEFSEPQVVLSKLEPKKIK